MLYNKYPIISQTIQPKTKYWFDEHGNIDTTLPVRYFTVDGIEYLDLPCIKHEKDGSKHISWTSESHHPCKYCKILTQSNDQICFCL